MSPLAKRTRADQRSWGALGERPAWWSAAGQKEARPVLALAPEQRLRTLAGKLVQNACKDEAWWPFFLCFFSGLAPRLTGSQVPNQGLNLRYSSESTESWPLGYQGTPLKNFLWPWSSWGSSGKRCWRGTNPPPPFPAHLLAPTDPDLNPSLVSKMHAC